MSLIREYDIPISIAFREMRDNVSVLCRAFFFIKKNRGKLTCRNCRWLVRVTIEVQRTLFWKKRTPSSSINYHDQNQTSNNDLSVYSVLLGETEAPAQLVYVLKVLFSKRNVKLKLNLKWHAGSNQLNRKRNSLVSHAPY